MQGSPRPDRGCWDKGSELRLDLGQNYFCFFSVLLRTTYIHSVHREPDIPCQPILNRFFVFQGSTVAREASDKEKVSTTVLPLSREYGWYSALVRSYSPPLWFLPLPFCCRQHK